jgi:predicted glycoside hydrolase/deacetylase ChbG (UPF0249 family)
MRVYLPSRRGPRQRSRRRTTSLFQEDLGVTEIGCHPGVAEDLKTMYSAERLIELATLCDPRVRSAIAEVGLQLRSFAAWRSYAVVQS